VVQAEKLTGFEALKGRRHMNLTTFRRDGSPVRTPVWFSETGGRLYVFTGRNTGKVKRISNGGGVLVGPCDMRGRPLGPETAGVARVLPSSERSVAEKSLNRRYPLQRQVFGPIQGLLGRGEEVYLEISPSHGNRA
jgi:uncharacterized protein